MSPFRRRRHDVGTYEPPAEVPAAPADRVIEEGVLIAESSVRMQLRNRIIVDVLRDRRDFDREMLVGLASMAFDELADREWESAERRAFSSQMELFDDEHAEERTRRESLRRALSQALADRAADPVALDAVVERSRDEAWSEISDFIERRAGDVAPHEADPSYDVERAERLATFVVLDLAGLAADHGVLLE